MAHTPARILILFIALLVLTLPCAVAAETPDRPGHRHIRTTDQRLVRLVEEGARTSETFRRLVERIHHSDVVVYLECAGNGSPEGRLAFVSSAGGRRYVHVRVAHLASADQQIALIGHELRHAVEIADAPEVIDEPSLARAYQRIGFQNFRPAAGTTFDSDAAVEAGYQVLRELLGKDASELPTPGVPSARY